MSSWGKQSQVKIKCREKGGERRREERKKPENASKLKSE